MSITIPFSQACERNKDVILDVITPYLADAVSVLEVGSGTAQHSIHFAKALPHLQWQTSDQIHYLEGIRAALANAKEINNPVGEQDVACALAPIELNVNQPIWVKGGQRYDAIYTANTLHIMTQSDVEMFFAGLSEVSHVGSCLIVYGPFKYGGEFTSQSNGDFDASLRSRGVGSAIRDYEFVIDLASAQGFDLVIDRAMPANNQCLIWNRSR